MTAMDGGNAGSAGACAGLMYYLYTPLPQIILPCLIIARYGITNRYCARLSVVKSAQPSLLMLLLPAALATVLQIAAVCLVGLLTCETDFRLGKLKNAEF
jgi:hypothetical protein